MAHWTQGSCGSDQSWSQGVQLQAAWRQDCRFPGTVSLRTCAPVYDYFTARSLSSLSSWSQSCISKLIVRKFHDKPQCFSLCSTFGPSFCNNNAVLSAPGSSAVQTLQEYQIIQLEKHTFVDIALVYSVFCHETPTYLSEWRGSSLLRE